MSKQRQPAFRRRALMLLCGLLFTGALFAAAAQLAPKEISLNSPATLPADI